MSDNRLPTELWVSACLRRCSAEGVPAYVVHRGAPAAGTVMVKIVISAQGCRLLNQSRDMDGELCWMDLFDGASVAEMQADEYIARALKRDPDLWVIEVEDKAGRNPFTEKIAF